MCTCIMGTGAYNIVLLCTTCGMKKIPGNNAKKEREAGSCSASLREEGKKKQVFYRAGSMTVIILDLGVDIRKS